MRHMRRLKVREIHHRTGAIIDQVAAGDELVIEKRGVPRPSMPVAKGFPQQHWERLTKFPKLRGDSGRYISRDRDRD